MNPIEKLKYPIGKFHSKEDYTITEAQMHLNAFGAAPVRLGELIKDISTSDSLLTYRDGGWNIRQIVHHLVDSHLNSYIRFKLALTEDTPTIKAYEEGAWALTPDYSTISVDDAYTTISLIHNRVVALCSSFTESEWNKKFYHPEAKMLITLSQNIAMYHWHSDHHIEHVRMALGISQ